MKKRKCLAALLALSMAVNSMTVMAAEMSGSVDETYSYESEMDTETTVSDQAEEEKDAAEVDEAITEKVERMDDLESEDVTTLTEETEMESEADTDRGDRPVPGRFVQYNEQISYTVNDDGETCRVQCADRNISGTVEIPSELDGLTVTEIADNGFEDCYSMEKIILPDTLTRIGKEAFVNCQKLPVILIPESVKQIGDRAFESCEILTVLFRGHEVPEGQSYWLGSGGLAVIDVFKVGETTDGRFHYYLSKSNGAGVYQYVGDEEEVVIPSEIEGVTVQLVSNGCFRENNTLRKVEIPDSVTALGSYAFYYCSNLEEISMPENLISIGMLTFSSCEKLDGFTLAESLEKIGLYAFRDCSSLTSIVIPNKITELDGAFEGCASLKNVTLPEGLVNLDSYAFEDCTLLEEIVLPESLTEIGYYTFEGCTSLTSITIPKNVTKCRESFLNCTNLALVQIESPTIAKDIITQNSSGYITKYAKTIIIPKSIEEVGSHILDNFVETSEIVQNDIAYTVYSNHTHDWHEVSNSGYTGCDQEMLVNYTCAVCGLEKTEKRAGHEFGEWTVEKEATCTESGERNRQCLHCDYIETEIIPAVGHQFENGICTICGEKEKKSGKFGNLTWTLCDGVLTISGQGEMQNFSYETKEDSPWYDDRGQIHKICIEEGVTSIGDYAFYNIRGDLTVELPETLIRIGEGAFSCCYDLQAIQIPESVREIGRQAFNNCDRVTVMFKASQLPDGLNQEWNWPCDQSAQVVVNVSGIGETGDGNFLYYVTGDGYAGVYEYLKYEENVVIPDTIEGLPVKKISTATFMDNSSVVDVIIPNTVELIEYHAFYECRNLTHISWPENLVSIGEKAFQECKKLENIELHDRVEYIGEWAFRDCASITSVVIPNGVTRLNNGVFDSCNSLKNVTLSDYLVSMDYYVFTRCSALEEIQLPESLEDIGFHSFADTGLKSITIPKNVRYCDEAFEDCNQLKLVQIESPYIAKNIGTKNNSSFVTAEYLCKYADTVVLPISIKEIGSYILENFTQVTDLSNEDGDYKVYSNHSHEWQEKTRLGYEQCKQDGNVVYSCAVCGLEKTEWVSAHDLSDWMVSKEATCTEKGERVRICSHCDYRETETIAATGHHYVDGKCTNCGKMEMINGTCGDHVTWTLGNDGLLTISGTGKMTNYTSIKSVPWYNYVGQIKQVVIEKGVTSIGNFAFYGLKDIQKVSVPKGVEIIGDYAFKNCTGLENVVLPKNLWKIGESAFYGCQSLKAVNMPDTITVMGAYAFKGCVSMESVYISKGLVGLNESAFYGCQSLRDITIPEGIKRIDGYVFKNCSGVQTVSLPGTLVKLGDSAFYGCSSLTELTVPENVTVINGYTFKNCTSLEAVSLPEKLASISEAAFYGCTGLTEMDIPENVTNIYSYAFKNCTALKVINLPTSLVKISESSFYGCKSLATVTIPENVTVIDGYAFKSCTGLTDIQLPENLETIGGSAFYGCTSLAEVTIPEKVQKIDGYAFSRCSGLKEIDFTGDAPTIDSYSFSNVTADAKYPAGNTTWTVDKRQNYGGKLTWSEQ